MATARVKVAAPTIVDLIGERGKDFVEIWHSPESPQECVMIGRDRLRCFRNATIVTKDEEEDAVIDRSADKGHYYRSDPDLVRPLVCDFCKWPFYSQAAFTRHTRFSHSGTTRK